MEATYQITPEMLGLTWRKSLLNNARHAILSLLGAMLVALKTDGIWTLLGEAAILTLIATFLLRPMSAIRLRITDDAIEDLDGPVIPKHSIASVTELTEGCPGLEVLGERSHIWLPKYRIFIPAALPQFEEVKQVLLGWQFSAAGSPKQQ